MDLTETLRQEVERLSKDLEQSARITQALEAENRDLQERWDEQEALLDVRNHELDILREALAKVQTSQKLSMCTGVEQEESLLEEKESKEASLTSSLQGLERELRQTRQELLRLQDERDRLATELDELSRQQSAADLERRNLRSDLREAKQREQRLLTDINDLEEQNVSLQKDVASLQSSQVEFEAAKHEVQHLQEEVNSMKSQLHDAESLRDIMEKKLEEALEAFQSEREQKYALRRELDQRLTAESPVLHLGGLSFASFNLDTHRQSPQRNAARHRNLPAESARSCAKISRKPTSYQWNTYPLPTRTPLLKAVHCTPLHLQGNRQYPSVDPVSDDFEKAVVGSTPCATCFSTRLRRTSAAFSGDMKTEALLELLSADVKLSNMSTCNGKPKPNQAFRKSSADLRRARFTGNGENGTSNCDSCDDAKLYSSVDRRLLTESWMNSTGPCSGKPNQAGNKSRTGIERLLFGEDEDSKEDISPGKIPSRLPNGLLSADATLKTTSHCNGWLGQTFYDFEADAKHPESAHIMDSKYCKDSVLDDTRPHILSDGLPSATSKPGNESPCRHCANQAFHSSDVDAAPQQLAGELSRGAVSENNGPHQLSGNNGADIAKPYQDLPYSVQHDGREDGRSSTENSASYLDPSLSACRSNEGGEWDDEDSRSEASILAEHLMVVHGPPAPPLVALDVAAPPLQEAALSANLLPQKKKKHSWRRKSLHLLSRVSCSVVNVIFAP